MKLSTKLLKRAGLKKETVKGTALIPTRFVPPKPKCNDFGGLGSEGYNAMMSALFHAAGGEANVYPFIERTPKASLVVELVDALRDLGYDIVPR